jgi:hypothetical protein
MTDEGDSVVFVIHQVAAVREAIREARRSDGLICRTDFVAAC